MEGAREAEAITQMVTRVVLDGSVFLVRISGKAGGAILNALAAAKHAGEHHPGSISLTKMLKSGKELQVTTFYSEDVDIKRFKQEADRYGIQYCLVARSDDDKSAGTYDVLYKTEDVVRMNRILERLKVAQVETSGIDVEKEGVSESAFEKSVSSARELMEQMIQPSPDLAADPSVAFYRMADIPDAGRRPVKTDISIINENIAMYQPQNESQNAIGALLANMLQPKEEAAGTLPELKSEWRNEKKVGEVQADEKHENDKPARASDDEKVKTNTYKGATQRKKGFRDYDNSKDDALLDEMEALFRKEINNKNEGRGI